MKAFPACCLAWGVLLAVSGMAEEKSIEKGGHVCENCSHHFLSPFIDSGTGAEKILLRNRVLVPAAGAKSAAIAETVPEDRHLIVQFEAGTIEAGLAALRSRGVEVLEWVPNYAVSVRVPPGVTLSGIGEVRWAGALQKSDKISSYIDPGLKAGQHVVVDLFPGADAGKVEAKLRNLEIKTIPNPHLGSGTLLVSAPGSDLAKIAEIDEVAYLFPASKDVVSGKPVRRCPGPMTTFGPLAKFVTNGEGWEGQGLNPISLTYHFRNGTDQIAGNDEEAIVVDAITTWSDFAQITWTATASSNLTRSMDFEWGPHPSYPFDGSGGTLAYCFFPSPPNSEPVAGDCHFDPGENWTDNGGSSGIDLYSVALHEAGHGLGLSHSDDPNAVMYPYYQYVTGLRSDDIAGIRALYASTGGGGGGGGGADSFEPDDNPGDASLLSNASGQSHSIVPANDVDWAFFDLAVSADVVIETSGPSGDTRMWLFDAAVSSPAIEFDDDDGADFFSRIERNLPAGRYYVAIDEYNNNNEIASYTLTLNHNATGVGDSFEPDNSSTNASTITNGQVQVHSIIPASDIDYIRFSLTEDSDVSISTDGPSGDTRMWLYGSNLSVIEFNDDRNVAGGDLFSVIDRRAADGDALPAGTYYILIDEFGNNDEIATYSLELVVNGAGTGDDVYETNNTRATATDHGFNWERFWLTEIRGPGIQSDEDWYRIDVSPAGYELVAADLDFTHAEGDIDLALWDESGTRLAVSQTLTDDESIRHIVPASGTYYLQVYFGDAGNIYDLRWDDLERTSTRRPRPKVEYRSPRKRSLAKKRQKHQGRATDDKGIVRVRYRLPRSGWRRAAYSDSSKRWAFSVKRDDGTLKDRRWFRVTVKAWDGDGDSDTDTRVFRRY